MFRAPIKRIDSSDSMFLDYSSLIFGPSKTGKTNLLLNIIHGFRNEVGLIYVICPTDIASGTFSELLPSPFIFNDLFESKTNQEASSLLLERLNRIYESQNRITIMKKKTMSLNILNQVASTLKLSLLPTTDPRNIQTQIKEHVKQMDHKRIPQPIKHFINFFDWNPRTVIIFDDCIGPFTRVFKNSIMETMVFMGRHFGITLLILSQSTIGVPPSIRTGIQNLIFTTSGFSGTVLTRDHNLSKREVEVAEKTIFKSKYQYLVYSSEAASFFHMQADIAPSFKILTPEMTQSIRPRHNTFLKK